MHFQFFKIEPNHTKQLIGYNIYALEETIENVWVPVMLRLLNGYDEVYLSINLSNWTEPWLDKVIDELKDRMGWMANYCTFEKCQKYPYYYYHAKPRWFIRVQTHRPNLLRKLPDLLLDGIEIPGISQPIVLKTEEGQIDNIRKLLTRRNLEHCSYVETEAELILPYDQISNLSREYWVKLDDLTPAIYPEGKALPTICLGMYDIETYSHIHTRMPDSFNPKHEMYLLSFAVERILGQANSRECWVLTSKYPPNLYPDGAPTQVTNIMDFIDSSSEGDVLCHVVFCPTEMTIVREFERLIVEVNIDILGSYNGHTYDFPFIKNRMDVIHNEELGCIGRIADEPTKFKEPIPWQSSAYGLVEEKWFDFKGRICVDLIQLVKREYKLRFYNLKAVTKEFLKREKIDLPAVEQFRIYEQGNAEEWDLLWRYSARDSVCLLDLFKRFNVWTSMVELSKVTKVSLQDLYTRGQQIRVESCIYDEVAKSGYVLTKPVFDTEKFQGAIVQEPTAGLYEQVLTFDFSSLYPSIMIEFNISHDTLIKDGTKINPDKVIEIAVTDEATGEVKVFRWLKPEIKQGIMPRMLQAFLSGRNAIKAELKKLEKDPVFAVLCTILNARGNALKVSANSFYGFLGAVDKGRLPLIQGAICVTKMGRELITKVANFVRTTYKGKVVYGDTDSVMVILPTTPDDLKLAMKYGEEVASNITKLLGYKSVKIMFENMYYRFLLFKKKMYISIKVSKDGKVLDGEDDIVYKGVSAARREHAEWTINSYKHIVKSIMVDRASRKDVYDYVDEQIKRMLTLQVPRDDCVVIKNLGSYDVDSTYFLNDFMKQEELRGRKHKGGERIGMIVCKNNPGLVQVDKAGYRYRDASDPSVEFEHLDTYYYIANNLSHPITTVLETVYVDELPPKVITTSRRNFTPPVLDKSMTKADRAEVIANFYNQINQPAIDTLTHIDTWARLIELHDKINKAIIEADGHAVKRQIVKKGRAISTPSTAKGKQVGTVRIRPAIVT